MTEGLFLEEFEISGNSVSAAVCVLPQNLRVSDGLAKTILALRPTLAEHTCKHLGFGYFGDRLVGTTLPHLVEHLAIDYLVEENRRKACDGFVPDGDASQAIAGITRWLDRDLGRMQVRISCTTQGADETCRAITRAIDVVNHLLGQRVW